VLEYLQMLNKEIVEEIFVESPVHDGQGRIYPIPLAGQIMLEAFRKDWLRENLPQGQIPLVSSGPKVLPDGTEGYSIRKEIVYKQKC